MAYEFKAGQASMFLNDKKESGDNRPNYQGEGKDLEGNPIRIALWKKTAANGKDYLSVSITPKVDQAAAQAPRKEDDDSIPF